jgi:hypothetical protein
MWRSLRRSYYVNLLELSASTQFSHALLLLTEIATHISAKCGPGIHLNKTRVRLLGEKYKLATDVNRCTPCQADRERDRG